MIVKRFMTADQSSSFTKRDGQSIKAHIMERTVLVEKIIATNQTNLSEEEVKSDGAPTDAQLGWLEPLDIGPYDDVWIMSIFEIIVSSMSSSDVADSVRVRCGWII